MRKTIRNTTAGLIWTALHLMLAAALGVTAAAQGIPGQANFPDSIDTPTGLYEAKDNSATALTETLGASDTTATVTSTDSFPATGAWVVDSEVVYYTGKTSTTFTGLIRAQGGTTAASHSSGAGVRGVILAAYHERHSTAIINTQTKLGAGASTPAAGKYLRGTGTGTSAWLDPELDASAITTGALPDSRIASAAAWNATQPPIVHGNATFSGAGTKDVTLPAAQASASYRVVLGCDASEDIRWSNKTTTGFTLVSTNPTSTASCDWFLIVPAENILGTFVFDGNSMTRGALLNDPTTMSYASQAEALLRSQGANYAFYNFGVDGQTTPQMAAGAVSQIDPLINHDTEWNFLAGWEGANHIFLDHVDGPTAYAALVDYYTARKNAGWKVIVMTLLPRGNWTADNETARQYVNTQLRAHWAEYGVALADVDAITELQTPSNTTNGTWYYDTVHLTRYGYALVADAVVDQVVAVKPPPDPWPAFTAPVTWTNATGVSVGGDNSLTKTANGTWGTGGASTTNTISSTGGFQVTATETTRYRLIGFSISDVNRSYQELTHALYFQQGAVVWLMEAASNVASPLPYATGEAWGMRIVTINGTRRVQYLRKGVVILMSSTLPPSTLRIDTAFLTVGGTIAAPLTVGFTP